MLAFSNAARLGFVTACLGGLGRIPAFAALIGITVLGLGAVLAASAEAFLVIKIAGAVYLVYTGFQLLLKAKQFAEMQSADLALKALMRRDFTMAIAIRRRLQSSRPSSRSFLIPRCRRGRSFCRWRCLPRAGSSGGGALCGGVRCLGVSSSRAGVFVNLNRLVGGALIAAAGSMALSRH